MRVPLAHLELLVSLLCFQHFEQINCETAATNFRSISKMFGTSTKTSTSSTSTSTSEQDATHHELTLNNPDLQHLHQHQPSLVIGDNHILGSMVTTSPVEFGQIDESESNLTKTTKSCHRREYTFRALNSDSQGRRCWQYITIMSCWGRCDSGEIADWRFPYKKSFHPVCIHERIRFRRIRLRHCDPGVDPALRVYTYIEALSCACAPCQSKMASCEGISYGTTIAP